MIEGQVAAIINSRELAINRGSEHGVEPGMKFEVLEKGGVAITDPETEKKLGSVTIIKVRVRVTSVERKWSVAQTYETIGGSGITLGAWLTSTSPPRVRTLRTDEAIVDPLTEAESFVKRGDPVREIIETKTAAAAAEPVVKKATGRPGEPGK